MSIWLITWIDEEEPDDVEILDDDPILESKYIKHKGDINRIRVNFKLWFLKQYRVCHKTVQ